MAPSAVQTPSEPIEVEKAFDLKKHAQVDSLFDTSVLIVMLTLRSINTQITFPFMTMSLPVHLLNHSNL